MLSARATIRTISLVGAAMLAGNAAAQGGGKALPHADFYDSCPFTVAAPSVVPVLDAKKWRDVVAASRRTPPPYDAAATDFRKESVFIVALATASNTLTQATLAAKKPERYEETTGTLTLFYDVTTKPASVNDMATGVGDPCLVTFTTARHGLQQVVTRAADGRYIAGARTAEKSKKKK